MRNRVVTIICILAILITTVIAAADGRQTMTFSNDTERLFELDQIVDGKASNDPSYNEWIYPMVGELSETATETRTIGNETYTFATNPNVKDRVVTVKNVVGGNSEGAPVFVRTLFAFESAGLTLEEFHDAMYININADAANHDSGWTWMDNTEWVYVEMDSVGYYVTTATYKGALNANETTTPSLLQFGLSSNVSSDTADKFKDGKFRYIIKSQAVQVADTTDTSVEKAIEMLNGAFGEVGETNTLWIDNVFNGN